MHDCDKGECLLKLGGFSEIEEEVKVVVVMVR
jgi:hypothetical protein